MVSEVEPLRATFPVVSIVELLAIFYELPVARVSPILTYQGFF